MLAHSEQNFQPLSSFEPVLRLHVYVYIVHFGVYACTHLSIQLYRKKLRLRPGYDRYPLMGDSIQMHAVFGFGLLMPDPNRMLTVLSSRIAELGERHRLSRHVQIYDQVIHVLYTLSLYSFATHIIYWLKHIYLILFCTLRS